MNNLVFSSFDPFGSLIPILFNCLRYTSGPILELGAGTYSTPLVHMFAINGRYARTIENNLVWYDTLKKLFSLMNGNFSHDLIHSEYDTNLITDYIWDLVIIDHATVYRARDLQIVKQLGCNLILVHDTEDPGYNVEPILQTFKFRFDDKRFPCWTTVVSDISEDLIQSFNKEV